MPRAERPPPRFELDRTWILRAIVAVVVIAMIALIAKVSMMVFGGSSARLDRQERAIDAPPSQDTAPAKPVATPAPR